MNYKTIINLTEKIYLLLEKMGLNESIDIDTFLDNNYPRISSAVQKYLDKERIIFCSTNGKRTSANILNNILEANNSDFITNFTSDGKIHPITTSVLFGNSKNKDEKSNILNVVCNDNELIKNFNLMNFDYLVLGNIFSSQTDFASVYEKKKKLQDAIILNSKLNLVINADDPMLFEIDEIKNDIIIGKKRNKTYSGHCPL